MLTQKGEILNVVSGYIAPKELLEELEFTLSVFASLDDPRVPREKRVSDAQADFLKTIDKKVFASSRGRPSPEMMQGFARRRVRQDHLWAKRNALMDAQDFRPATLVGNGRSFFASSSGGKKQEPIGDRRSLDLLDRLREGDLPPDGEDGKEDRERRKEEK